MNKDESVANNLFLGSVLTENIFPYPKIKEEESELISMIIDTVDKFMENKSEIFRQYDNDASQPSEYIDTLKQLGLFGLIVPEEHSGIGLSNRGYSRALQQVGRYDASTALTIGAHSSIGMRGLVLFGNDDQKKEYLEKLATGEMIAAFCLTESGSGSDAASIKTTATKNEDGTWTLNGEKIWITNGPFAEFFTVFAKTDGDSGKLSAFIVEKSFDGVSTGHKEDKMGIRASATSTVVFTDVKVPAKNLLGEEGKGFKIAMSILNSGRTGLGGGSVGAMKNCIKLATEQSTNRKQFGKKISDFQLIKNKITQMSVDCFAAESLVNIVGALIDEGSEDYSIEAAISKVYSTEALWRVSNEALQIAGGNGFMKEFPYERIVRDSRINMIFEGTNEILRLYIALSGYKTAGNYLKEIGKAGANAFNDPIKGFGVLGSYIAKKFTQTTGINADDIPVDDNLKEYADIFSDYTLAFSKIVEDILKEHKKEVIGKQLISKRVADIAIDLLTGYSVLSRVDSIIKEKGASNAKAEITICKIFTQAAKRRMNQNLRRIENNEDSDVDYLADFIIANDGYNWDIL